MSKNINMKDDSGPMCVVSREKKAAALNFISVTPRQLIEKEGREQKQIRVNLYAKGGGFKDLIGHKEDFRFVQTNTPVFFYFGSKYVMEISFWFQSECSIFTDDRDGGRGAERGVRPQPALGLAL